MEGKQRESGIMESLFRYPTGEDSRSILHISLGIADSMEPKPFGRYPIFCGGHFFEKPAIY
jgi:hypothetical protein